MEIRTTSIYEQCAKAWVSGKRRALNEGGTASSKTWSILQLLILIAMYTKTPLLISVVSESLPHLKRGAIRDFFKILGEDPKSCPRYNMAEHTYNFGKGKIEFFGADESDKIRGPRRDILFINEGNNVPWETARGLDIRTIKFTFMDWNPVSEFWVHQYEDARGKVIPGWIKEENSAYIHSTYLDAIDVIPQEVVANIESNKDKDPNWWNVYGLGKLGKIEGLVYPVFQQIDGLPGGDAHNGLDFGFSNDPTALVRSIIKGEELYSRELIYETGLTNQDISGRMEDAGLRKHYDEIFADSAEPKSIEELYRMGWNIKGAPKGPGSVEFGHQKIRQYNQYWTKDSINCIKEQRNFRYIPDKNGKLTDKTTHNWSHCLIAGTLIKTRRGDIPIEQVSTNDFVLTREGWQSVKASGMVSPEAEVQTVTFSNQKSITSTPNHQVYVDGKGYAPLYTLRYGDIIEVCQRVNEFTTRVSGITATQIPQIGQTGITTAASRMEARIGFSIGKCGWIYTVLSQTGLKFIIKMMTPLIITMRILNAYLNQNITNNILYQSGGLNGCGNTLMLSDQNLLSGINQKRAGNGTGNTGLQSIKREFTETANVAFAGRFIKHFLNLHKISSVLTNVNQRIGGRQEQTISPELASGVAGNSRQINIANHEPAPVYVLSVSGVLPKRQPVYDLTIDGLPEFYANGILVHNSMDARRYGIIGKVEPRDREDIIIYDAMAEVDLEL